MRLVQLGAAMDLGHPLKQEGDCEDNFTPHGGWLSQNERQPKRFRLDRTSFFDKNYEEKTHCLERSYWFCPSIFSELAKVLKIWPNHAARR